MDHALRRKRLAEWLADSGIGALLVTRLPNVRYLTGFSGSNGQVILGADAAVFLTDGRYVEQSRREVPDLDRRVYAGDLVQAVAEACASLGLRRMGFETSGVTHATYLDLAERAGVELVAVAGAVEGRRWVKDEEELRLLERAQEATDLAFQQVLGTMREGVTERDVALELEVALRRAGAEAAAFSPIVAFGESAAEPHHRPTDRPLARGDVAKLDFGARVGGYHADMTRTVALGEPPAELRDVHALVRRAQLAGIEAAAPRAAARDVDRAARSVVEEAGHGAGFSHGLGHGVGLEIHEGPSVRATSHDVLLAGAVVTIEPGVYVAGLGGVRIEDMVVVQEGGARVMGQSIRDLIVL